MVTPDLPAWVTGVSYFHTWKTKSGQICAQAWQAVQPASSAG